MGIELKRVYLSVLDNDASCFDGAKKAIDKNEEGVYAFIEKGVQKCIKNANGRSGKFLEHSKTRELIQRYRQRQLSLMELGNELAHQVYHLKNDHEIFTVSNFMMGEFVWNENTYIFAMETNCQEGMVCQTKTTEEGNENILAVETSILPKPNNSNTRFFMMNEDTMELTILEPKLNLVDDEGYLYAEKLLVCETNLSIKEAVKTAREIANTIIDDHQLDKLSIVPALERTIKETINEGKDLNLSEIAEEVFHESPEAIQSYSEEAKKVGIEKPVENQNKVKLPIKKMQKIITDTGIEINIPLDYYNNKDYIQLEKTKEGRFSIQLINIANVQNA